MTDEGERMRAAEHRLVTSMRAALASYDGADPSERHAATCPCAICEYVRSCRAIVDDWDAWSDPKLHAAQDVAMKAIVDLFKDPTE